MEILMYGNFDVCIGIALPELANFFCTKGAGCCYHFYLWWQL